MVPFGHPARTTGPNLPGGADAARDAADSRVMTLLGVAWLLAFLLVFYGLVRVVIRLCTDDPAPARLRSRAAAVVAVEQPLVPAGWTVADYAADGIRGLQVLLAQHARRRP